MSKTIKSHSSRSLDEWLSYLESIHKTEIDLGLERIGIVAERLSINFDFAKVVTVAGTNGKGTTCAFIENALLAAGKSVAVYSSPHIECFNERLRINKDDVLDEPLINAFDKIEQARADISLTYYEYTTLACFLVLMEQQPEVIILEVGLGGRLDATNLIDADIAVVTTVDLDHQAFLGNTREKIGYEKAGIFRAGKIAVIGDVEPTNSVLSYANDLGAVAKIRNKDFLIENGSENWAWEFEGKCLNGLAIPHIPLDNVATALVVLSELAVVLDSEKANQWIAATKVAGRTELFANTEQADTILDVGHNPQAARYLSTYLKRNDYSKVHAVVGMMKDKDSNATLSELSNDIGHWYFGTLAVDRADNAENIAKALGNNKQFNCFDNIEQAYKMALENADKDDLILVFGSFFTVSAIRRLLV